MDLLNKYSEQIKGYCKANKIKKLSLFGSYLTNTHHEVSDVDLLVEFNENANYGLLDVARMERELSEIIGKKVDLRTPNELSRYFRDIVVREASVFLIRKTKFFTRRINNAGKNKNLISSLKGFNSFFVIVTINMSSLSGFAMRNPIGMKYL